MKYKIKTDWWISLLFYFTFVVLLVPIMTIPKDEILFYLLPVGPILIFAIWTLFGSNYELREEVLFMRIGPITKKVRYDNIKSISFKKSWSSSWAMTRDRVVIELNQKTLLKSDIQIGPKDKEEFTDDLKRRCKNL